VREAVLCAAGGDIPVGGNCIQHSLSDRDELKGSNIVDIIPNGRVAACVVTDPDRLAGSGIQADEAITTGESVLFDQSQIPRDLHLYPSCCTNTAHFFLSSDPGRPALGNDACASTGAEASVRVIGDLIRDSCLTVLTIGNEASDPTFTVGVPVTGDCVLSDTDSILVHDLDSTRGKAYTSHPIHLGADAASSVVETENRDLCLTVLTIGNEASDSTVTVGVSITGDCVLSGADSFSVQYGTSPILTDYTSHHHHLGASGANSASLQGGIRTVSLSAVGPLGASCDRTGTIGCKSATFRSACRPPPVLFARSLPIIPPLRVPSSTHALSGGAPSYVPFTQLQSVVTILRDLQKDECLTLGHVKLAARRAMAALGYCSSPKPNAFFVEEMFVPHMFQGGADPLPPGDRPLDVLAMDKFHVAACTLCVTGNVVHSDCYWHLMRLPIQNGWVPHLSRFTFYPKYSASGADGNHLSASLYPGTVQKEIQAQLEAGICTAFPAAPPGVIVNPLGVIIKKSDIARAKNCTGVLIKCQPSLDAANAILKSKGLPVVKGRPITDATATGANEVMTTPPFSNSGIGDAVALISPGCVMGKLDVSRYFHQFPMAPSARWLFWFFYGLLFYRLNRIIFGAGPSPYVTSGYGAEVRKWVLHAKVPAVHFCDDWFTAGKRRPDTERFLRVIAAFFIACGFAMAIEKEEIGQRLVYLGVMFDSVKMVLSFDPASASSFASELREALVRIRIGKQLTSGEKRHIAGKLSHFSQVLQQGRMKITHWWAYFHHGCDLSAVGFSRLIEDSEWWLRQLDAWSLGDHSSCEYPILSSSVLATDPQKVVILQSDASGPDGFGYIWGFLDEVDPQYYSAQWGRGELILCDRSSHYAELRALDHFIRSTEFTDKVLFWVTDSQSAFYSVNKGTCHEYESRDLLSSILSRCDILHISVLAIWVPRDYNVLPDYLSHLAFNLHRSEQSGRCSSL
jgi:hypothetical protein